MAFVHTLLMVGFHELISCYAPTVAFWLIEAAMTPLNLSARAYHCILKLGRTIADLARCEEIGSVHLAEALQYRTKLIVRSLLRESKVPSGSQSPTRYYPESDAQSHPGSLI
jgi:hypothetical protein